MIAIFDGHNDTLTRADAADFASGRDSGHVDLPRARAGGLAGGICALFASTPGFEWPGEAEPIGADLATPPLLRAAGRLIAFERAGEVKIVRARGELDAARVAGTFAAVMHMEGAEAIDPELEALEAWHALGLRSLGPVWSRSNAFAHGVPFAFDRSPDTGPGLTDAGVALVNRCADLGIAIDLSHMNEQGFWDVARLARAPLIASHSGAHAITPSTRNLTDEQVRAIGASGGLVGVPYVTMFVRPDGEENADTPLSAIAAHARHIAELIGVEHVALGSDFDGALIPDALKDVTGLPRLMDAFREAGFTDDELQRVAWDNWRRVLEAAFR